MSSIIKTVNLSKSFFLKKKLNILKKINIEDIELCKLISLCYKRSGDLTNYKKVNSYFRKIKPKYVIHCAAKSGGLKYNLENPAVIFSENLIILRNVLLNCSKFSIKKLILICNSCMYPEKIKRKFI